MRRGLKIKVWRNSFWVLSALTAAGAARAAVPAAPPAESRLTGLFTTAGFVSPEVRPDRTVTFRFRASRAAGVAVVREGAPPLALRPGPEGVWSVTTPPLAPDFYGYYFVVDGVRLPDPANPQLKTNLLNLSNLLHVPGPGTLPWEWADGPHGEVHHVFYRSVLLGDHRDYYVYTPPGYDAAPGRRYPTLYLLHGFSDDASGWTAVGRANFILDHLITAGLAQPMVVVMPLGYGRPEIVHQPLPTPDAAYAENIARFGEGLLDEIIPAIERTYRVRPEREYRALAGLSMGGAETLIVGLNHLERFAWLGAFSAGAMRGDFAATFPHLQAVENDRIRLLWLACGTEDPLWQPNRRLWAWLTAQGIRHLEVETPGMHTWMVWRRNLAAFAPLLFQPGSRGRTRGDPGLPE